MAPGCFNTLSSSKNQESSSEISNNEPSSDSILQTFSKNTEHTHSLHCENLFLTKVLIYSSYADSLHLDQIPLPVSPAPATAIYSSSALPVFELDDEYCVVGGGGEEEELESDSESSDDDQSSSDSDSSDASSEEEDSDNENENDEQDEDARCLAETSMPLLKKSIPSSRPKNFLSKLKPTHFPTDTVDSFEILEQTILKQKRLARLKNTDLRKKILLKRTFDLVCEIMDKENGFDDLDDKQPSVSNSSPNPPPPPSSPPQACSTDPRVIEQASPDVNASLNPTSLTQELTREPIPPLKLIKLDPSHHLADSSDLNDIIYINLVNQSDLLESFGSCSATAEAVVSNGSSVNANVAAAASLDSKRRRMSNEDDEEDEEDFDEYDDYYSTNQNILVLNKNNEYDLNEKVLSEFSSSLLSSGGGDVSANAVLFYASSKNASRKRTRFSD